MRTIVFTIFSLLIFVSVRAQVAVDFRRPLYTGNALDGDDRFRFLWTSAIVESPGMFHSVGVDIGSSLRKGYYIYQIDATVGELYRYAYSDENTVNFSGFVIPAPRFKNAVTGSDTTKRYQYQLLAGRELNDRELTTMLREDLDRIFGFEVDTIVMKKLSIVLSAVKPTRVYEGPTQGPGGLLETLISVEGTLQSLLTFFKTAMKFKFPYPIVDETNGATFRFQVDCECYNIQKLNAATEPYGLRVALLERDIPVLVIRD